MPIAFSKEFMPHYGYIVRLNDGVRRITAQNPSPLTFMGTNSYLIGTKKLSLIDPGPDDNKHYSMLLDAIDGSTLDYIFITHSHNDHCGLANRLKEITGAAIVAAENQCFSRLIKPEQNIAVNRGCTKNFSPDIVLKDGESIESDNWKLTSIATPGHTANHTAFALDNTGILFTGDHVMAWSTTVIAPPEGSMHDYIDSLSKLLRRDDKVYLPGHGGPVYKPQAYVRAILAHRKMRERAILERLNAGDRTIEDIVSAIYRTVDPRLHKAASLSVLAHLEELIERGIVDTRGPITLSNNYFLSNNYSLS